MSDLTERLRATNKRVRHSQELRDEAADHIDKLQAALEGLHFHHKVFEPFCKLCVDQMMQTMVVDT